LLFQTKKKEELKFIAIQPEDSTDKIERVSFLIVLGFKATQDAIQDFTFKAFQMLDQILVTIKKLCLRHLERI
jgi:geranylgeranyl diphosphate synthase type II